LLANSNYAASALQEVAASLAVELCELIKQSIGADVILADVKKDTLRLIDKIEEYSLEYCDLGYLYVKDAVRMAFNFRSLEALKQAMVKLIDGTTPYKSDSSCCYCILEVKCKLSTKLRNVTIVIGYSGTSGERVLAEVQLLVVLEDVTDNHDTHFIEHLIYELERLLPEQGASDRPERLAHRVRSIFFKIYAYEFRGSKRRGSNSSNSGARGDIPLEVLSEELKENSQSQDRETEPNGNDVDDNAHQS
jgi:hypothetical protein